MTRAIRILLLLVLWAATAGAAERVVHGELVVLNAGTGQFRIVGTDGSFTAPPGTPLQALDGKAVNVALSDGRVIQISEQAVAITPITNGFETVRGQLVLRDATGQRFGVAGDAGSYAAPAGLDLHPYAGKWVEATIDGDGRATRVTLLADRPPPAPVPPAVDSAAMPGRATCAVGDATVASGSSICRAGVTQRCDDGAWVSLGTACQ
ncbi:hypothetical protein KF840_25970 [bacterium]|nr:hypothetical protein [bacterium]